MKLKNTKVQSLEITRFTLADVSTLRVPTPAPQADKRVLQALVDVRAGQAGSRKRVPVVALALEGAVHVDAASVGTYSSLKMTIYPKIDSNATPFA